MFCPNCGNLLIRCTCSTNKELVKTREKQILLAHKDQATPMDYLGKKLTVTYSSKIKGYRQEYRFYETPKSIISFCNQTLNVFTGVIPKIIISQVSETYFMQELEYPTIRTGIAKLFFETPEGVNPGYALQNTLLYLVSKGYATYNKHRHGLSFSIKRVYEVSKPPLSKSRGKSIEFTYEGSAKGYREKTIYHVYSSQTHFLVFKNNYLNLETSVIPKSVVKQVKDDYSGRTVEKVSTRILEASKYFPSFASSKTSKLGFKFLNVFIVMVVKGEADSWRRGRVLKFKVY